MRLVASCVTAFIVTGGDTDSVCFSLKVDIHVYVNKYNHQTVTLLTVLKLDLCDKNNLQIN